MKALIGITLLAFAPLAGAKTRCATEATNAVIVQAQLDFPGRALKVTIPDYNDENEQSVEEYVATVIVENVLKQNYRLLVNETCHVISSPVASF